MASFMYWTASSTGSTKIFTNAGSYNVTNCGGTDTGVIKREQDSGARISSNSWGCSGCAGTYDDSSQAYDVGVRDADLTEAGNQQMIYVFSAGNARGSGDNVNHHNYRARILLGAKPPPHSTSKSCFVSEGH